MDHGTDPVAANHPGTPQRPDDSRYRRLDLYVLLDGDRGNAKITAVVYGDRGQLVLSRLVLPGLSLASALTTALDVVRENWPELQASRLPFPPSP